MQKIWLALKSRTFWTLVVLFIVNGVSGVHEMIPAGWVPLVDTVLGFLTVYFHVNPSQNYH